MASSRSSVAHPLGQLACETRRARRSISGGTLGRRSTRGCSRPRPGPRGRRRRRPDRRRRSSPMSARAPAMHSSTSWAGAVDERRGHPGEQVLERQPLAERVERVAAVLGVAQHDGAVARRRRARDRRGRTAAPRASRPSAWRSSDGGVPDLVVAVAAGQLGEQLGALVGVEETRQVLAERSSSWSKPSRDRMPGLT